MNFYQCRELKFVHWEKMVKLTFVGRYDTSIW